LLLLKAYTRTKNGASLLNIMLYIWMQKDDPLWSLQQDYLKEKNQLLPLLNDANKK
jgi:hypothetical protein